jgi:hypothetical protein
MIEEDIEKEIKLENTKDFEELEKDIVREANASDKKDTDIIKHLIKRLAVHQIILQKKTSETNYLLIILSIVMALGALFSILTYFRH